MTCAQADPYFIPLRTPHIPLLFCSPRDNVGSHPTHIGILVSSILLITSNLAKDWRLRQDPIPVRQLIGQPPDVKSISRR